MLKVMSSGVLSKDFVLLSSEKEKDRGLVPDRIQGG